MSRPPPTFICSHTQNDLVIEVCEADAVYAVLYNGQAIKLRKYNPQKNYQGHKYGKTSFPEPGHAVRLANLLNEAHSTDAFTVAVMKPQRDIKL